MADRGTEQKNGGLQYLRRGEAHASVDGGEWHPDGAQAHAQKNRQHQPFDDRMAEEARFDRGQCQRNSPDAGGQGFACGRKYSPRCERTPGASLDIALVEGPVDDRRLEILPWRRDELAVIAPPDHPLAKKRRVSPADLAKAAFIVRERGSGTRQVATDALSAIGISAPIVLCVVEHRSDQAGSRRGARACNRITGCDRGSGRARAHFRASHSWAVLSTRAQRAATCAPAAVTVRGSVSSRAPRRRNAPRSRLTHRACGVPS